MGREQEAAAPFIAAIDEARAGRDRLREALERLTKASGDYHREFGHLLVGHIYPERVEFATAIVAARSALSPESNPEGQ